MAEPAAELLPKRLLGVALAYFAIAFATNFYFRLIGSDIPIVRPAIGFAAGFLLLYGVRYWPGIFVGSLVSRLVLGDPLMQAVLVAAGNALGISVGVLLARRSKGFDISLSTLRHHLHLLLWVSLLGGGIAALLGSTGYVLTRDAGHTLLSVWLRWMMGNALAITVVVPLMSAWHQESGFWVNARNWRWALAYLLVTFLAGQVIFLDWFADWLGSIALGYWIFAFLVWGAVQFGLQAAAMVVIIVMLQAFAGAALGIGFFGGDIVKSNLSNVWFYLLCLSLVGIGLGTSVQAFRRAQEQLKTLANHDELTGLVNRRLLVDRIDQAIHAAKRNDHMVALIFQDLDKFKPVNDTLGHQAGDILLQRVAQTLCDCVRESDTVARVGGDEFVILLPTIKSAHDALLIAEKIRQAMLEPFTILGHQIHISTSVGVALFPAHGTDHASLLVNADNAMYAAKYQGRNAVVLFDPSQAHRTPRAGERGTRETGGTQADEPAA